MRSCIALLYILASAAPVSATSTDAPHGRTIADCRSKNAGSPRFPDLRSSICNAVAPRPVGNQEQPDDPDALYADREHLASATRAADIWAARLASNPKDVESAWKLARARYWLGTQGLPEAQRKGALEAGIAAGRSAATIAPDRPEGHFWIAANMGALAESFGLRQGIKYRGEIRDELQKTLELDPDFRQGSADRALGRWYYKVPGMFGGSKQKSEEHLRKALTYNPQSIITRLFLAETLIDLDRKADARKELEAAVAAPPDPDWLPEDRRFKEQAKQLLSKLSR